MAPRPGPIGVILAGGLGRRIGGSKATVRLGGRPLIEYPLRALTQVLDQVAVIAKPDTKLPSLPGVSVWIEPQLPRHPVVGITHALAFTDGRPALLCAADLPFVTPRLIDRLARFEAGRSPAVVAAHEGKMQPLLGRYEPHAAELLGAPAAAERPLLETIAGIGPRLLEVEDPFELFNVNAPDDLLQAAAMLDRRGRPSTSTSRT